VPGTVIALHPRPDVKGANIHDLTNEQSVLGLHPSVGCRVTPSA